MDSRESTAVTAIAFGGVIVATGNHLPQSPQYDRLADRLTIEQLAKWIKRDIRLVLNWRVNNASQSQQHLHLSACPT